MAQVNEQNTRIGQDFSLPQLIRFAMPAILTTVCGQLFRSLDDGLFLSRYAGETALAAINLLVPVNCLVMGFAQLFSIGACTLSAQKMGEGKFDEARRIFTRICIVAASVGLFVALVMNLFCRPICIFLGADETLLPDAMSFVRIVVSNTAVNLLCGVFAGYYSTAGRPDMGLLCSVLNGATNVLLDIVFVAWKGWGVVGSSLSTAIGELVIFIVGVIFFTRKKNEIHFCAPKGMYVSTAVAASRSGFAQFINSISLSLTSFVSNHTLLAILGPLGVSASSVIGHLRQLLTAAFIGYVGCVGPIIAYNYGSKNVPRLKKILTHNLKFWFFGTLGLTVLGQLLRKVLIGIFIVKEKSPELYELAYTGLTIEFFACMFTAGCIFVMRMFVALGAPHTAAILTTSRNFIIRLTMLLLLPRLFNEIGVWLAFPVAEFLSFIVAVVLVVVNADNYGYGKSGVAWRILPAGTKVPREQD